MEEQKSITKIIHEVVEDICNNYCKWPNEYKPEEHDGVELFDSDICSNCPIGR